MSDQSIRLSGFSFIYNGLTLGYPFLESVLSIAALCDEVIINVCFENSEKTKDDGTWDFLNKHLMDPKFKFIKSFWDPEMDKSGLILSHHTNIALKECKGKYCHYIQGDEAIHEDDFDMINKSLDKMDQNENIEGIIYRYLHFYGNTDIIKHTRNTYRREIRLIRNLPSIQSHLDAQGFRHENGQKLNCKESTARVFHYGWAREQEIMNHKVKAFDKLYHGQDFEAKEFSYKRIWGLKKFSASHPNVMTKWIQNHKNDLDIMSYPLEFEWKNIGLAISDCVEHLTGHRLGEYKNFKII